MVCSMSFVTSGAQSTRCAGGLLRRTTGCHLRGPSGPCPCSVSWWGSHDVGINIEFTCAMYGWRLRLALFAVGVWSKMEGAVVGVGRLCPTMTIRIGPGSARRCAHLSRHSVIDVTSPHTVGLDSMPLLRASPSPAYINPSFVVRALYLPSAPTHPLQHLCIIMSGKNPGDVRVPAASSPTIALY